MTTAKQSNTNVTLRDIAERCGVGIATVSRAFNAPSSQNEKTSARILAVAAEMGYNPARNHAARRMASRQYGKEPINHLVALLLPEAFYHIVYFNICLQGIMAGLTEQGFSLLTIELSDDWCDNIPLGFQRGDIDGIIIHTGADRYGDISGALHALPTFGDRPLLMILEPSLAEFSVLVDRQSGAHQATTHLLELGHRHFIQVVGPNGPQKPILHGFQQACADYQLDPNMHLHLIEIGNELWDVAFGTAQHAKLASLENITVSDENPLLCELRRHPEITAILTPNDSTAIIVHHLLKHAGLRVPEDISLIGFDDTIPLCDGAWNNILTTVRLPLRQVGYMAAMRMVERITGTLDHDVCEVLPTTLVIRGTTAPPRKKI